MVYGKRGGDGSAMRADSSRRIDQRHRRIGKGRGAEASPAGRDGPREYEVRRRVFAKRRR